MNLLKKIMLTAANEDRGRYRDRRAFYASEALTCPRDLYWSLTGEKETNPTDFLGKMKMMVGSAVEEQLVTGLIKKAHTVGLHHIGSQVQCGGSNPNWDGNLDCLVYEAENNKRYVVEIKTKSGAGADFFWGTFDPGESYLAQLGLYLKDLSEKGITADGCFLFVLLSDKHFGDMVQIDCRYNKETRTISAYRATTSTGEARDLDLSFCIDKAFDNFNVVSEAVASKTPPTPAYVYKKPLTSEFLAEQSDWTLKAAMAGNKIIGDWQPRYSRYRDKAFAVDGTVREYTAEEMSKIKNEFNNRLTPTGRKRKQVA